MHLTSQARNAVTNCRRIAPEVACKRRSHATGCSTVRKLPYAELPSAERAHKSESTRHTMLVLALRTLGRKRRRAPESPYRIVAKKTMICIACVQRRVARVRPHAAAALAQAHCGMAARAACSSAEPPTHFATAGSGSVAGMESARFLGSIGRMDCMRLCGRNVGLGMT